MAYTGSKAGIGLGTVLSINTGTASTPVYTAVGEIKTIGQSGRQVAQEDTTNLDSAAREFIPTLLDSGSWDITGNRVGADAGQVALEAAFAGLTMKLFTIQLPKTATQTTSGDKFSFNALVAECNYSVALDKAVTFSAKLKVSGAVTVTPGS